MRDDIGKQQGVHATPINEAVYLVDVLCNTSLTLSNVEHFDGRLIREFCCPGAQFTVQK